MTSWLELEDRYKKRNYLPSLIPIIVCIISFICIFTLMRHVENIKVTHTIRITTTFVLSISLGFITYTCLC